MLAADGEPAKRVRSNSQLQDAVRNLQSAAGFGVDESKFSLEPCLSCLAEAVHDGMTSTPQDLIILDCSRVLVSNLALWEDEGCFRVAGVVNAAVQLITTLAYKRLGVETAPQIVQCILRMLSQLLPQLDSGENSSFCRQLLHALQGHRDGNGDASAVMDNALMLLGENDTYDRFAKWISGEFHSNGSVEIIVAAVCQLHDLRCADAALQVVWLLARGPASRILLKNQNVGEELMKIILSVDADHVPMAAVAALECLTRGRGNPAVVAGIDEHEFVTCCMPALVHLAGTHRADVHHAFSLLERLLSRLKAPAALILGSLQAAVGVLARNQSGNLAQESAWQLFRSLLDDHQVFAASFQCLQQLPDLVNAFGFMTSLEASRIIYVMQKISKSSKGFGMKVVRMGGAWRLQQCCRRLTGREVRTPVVEGADTFEVYDEDWDPDSLESHLDDEDEEPDSRALRWLEIYISTLMLIWIKSLEDDSMIRTYLRGMQLRASAAAAFVACFLAEHAPLQNLRNILVGNAGLQLLCDRLRVTSWEGGNQLPGDWRAGASSIHALLMRLESARKAHMTGLTPTTRQHVKEEYMNEERFSDVIFLVEGLPFYALKVLLVDASPIFKSMFDGPLAVQQGSIVRIPNTTYTVWEIAMRFVYTGKAEMPSNLAHQVLVLADQYLLDGLKELAQEVLAAKTSASTLMDMLAICDALDAPALQRHCIIFALRHWATGGSFWTLAASDSPPLLGSGEQWQTHDSRTEEAHMLALPSGLQWPPVKKRKLQHATLAGCSSCPAADPLDMVDSELRDRVADAVTPWVLHMLGTCPLC